MKTKLLLLLLMIAFTFSTCKKGDTGPQGPQGAQGTAGNANIQNYSITVSPSQWTYDNVYEIWYYRYSNSSNMNSAVLAYVISGNGEQAMPYYACPTSGAWCEQYDFATYLFGSPPYIEFQYTNYLSRTTHPNYDTNFYLVIMPPALHDTNPNVNWSNYKEVKAKFNLKD